jgi:hypothetical protein
MSTQTDPNAFLMGGGGRSAKFATIGDKIDGEITATEVTQQTDFTDGTPKTWPDGNPMMQLVITLQTDEREDDRLQLAYTGDGVAPKAGLNAPKEYAAKYSPPAAGSVNVDEIFGSD